MDIDKRIQSLQLLNNQKNFLEVLHQKHLISDFKQKNTDFESKIGNHVDFV